MEDLITAIALVFVIEGALYALFPTAMKRMIARALEISDGMMRQVGLLAAVAGVIVVWLVRG